MVVPVILILLGGLWALQGAGVVGGSFMSGDRTWLYIGVAIVLIGLISLVARLKRRP